jgi:polyhydroxybutyrate depolymerase
MSNGAFMTHRLALEAGDLVAVLAAVAGALPETHLAITPRHAVSALLINGTADPLVKLAGGYSRHRGPNGELRGHVLSQQDTTAHWIGVNRCAGDDTTSTTPPSGAPDIFGLAQRLVTGGVAGTTVTVWTIDGGGHSWPDPQSTMPEEYAAFVGPTARNFDTAAEICRFALPALAPAAARRL